MTVFWCKSYLQQTAAEEMEIQKCQKITSKHKPKSYPNECYTNACTKWDKSRFTYVHVYIYKYTYAYICGQYYESEYTGFLSEIRWIRLKGRRLEIQVPSVTFAVDVNFLSFNWLLYLTYRNLTWLCAIQSSRIMENVCPFHVQWCLANKVHPTVLMLHVSHENSSLVSWRSGPMWQAYPLVLSQFFYILRYLKCMLPLESHLMSKMRMDRKSVKRFHIHRLIISRGLGSFSPLNDVDKRSKCTIFIQ